MHYTYTRQEARTGDLEAAKSQEPNLRKLGKSVNLKSHLEVVSTQNLNTTPLLGNH